MRINNNIGALNTHRQMSINTTNQAKNMEKLSSGLKINRGADDAAGLSISEKMRAQIRGLDRAAQNAQDGISMIQTADGAMNESHAILQRMRELTVQAGNDTNSDNERTAIKGELDQLAETLEDISNRTQFNGQKLLAGGTDADAVGNAGVVTLQTGANSAETVTVDFTATKSVELASVVTTVKALDVTDAAKAAISLTSLDGAIDKVSTGRAYLGAVQNRLEYTINNLNSSSQNTQAAESRIRDVDMAKEVVENSKNGILAQAAQAMLAQANQQPQSVLQLLR
ncbi:flagellin [Neobacillus piezotolerans]|uniref:Flagellin n=1 Tax=Neobacillus piezotolerans TaxID=2259171 RepID=A0A3D8GP09_9BACI|nr:flagellin [Neobacillus piezotolerans]RDU35909.1 flagellin [Neobacillus piezotolerans]